MDDSTSRTALAETDPSPRTSWLRTDLKTLLVLVATSGVVMWAWRSVSDTEPTRAAIRMLRAGSLPARVESARTLGDTPPEQVNRVVPALIDALSDNAAEVREAAAHALLIQTAWIGREAASATPPPGLDRAAFESWFRIIADALTGRLGDRAARVRTQAATSLDSTFWVLTLPAQATSRPGLARWLRHGGTVEALVGRLDDPDAEVRVAAARALGTLARWGPFATPPPLVRALADETAEVRRAAFASLRAFAVTDPTPLPQMFRAWETERDRNIRAWFRRDFGGSLASAPAALPALGDALASRDPGLRAAVAEVLTSLGSAAVPTLVETMQRAIAAPVDPRAFVLGTYPASKSGRGESDPLSDQAGALGRIGQVPDDIRARLLAEMRSGKVLRAAQAARALGRLGPAGESTVPDLIATLRRSRDPLVLQEAILALGEIAPGTGSVAMAQAALEAPERPWPETVRFAVRSALAGLRRPERGTSGAARD